MNSRAIENLLSNTDEDDLLIIKCGNTIVEGFKRDLKYHFNSNKTLLDITNTNKTEQSHYLLTVGRIYAIEHYY